MAGASGKRIAASNAKTLHQLRLAFLITHPISLASWAFFPSLRVWKHLFYFFTTDSIALILWYQLEGMARRKDDVGSPGMAAYMFDIIYVTLFVHATTALISRKFWALYLSHITYRYWLPLLQIPLYALYRLYSFAKPYLFPSKTSSLSSQGSGKTSKATTRSSSTTTLSTQDSSTPTSKRQAKLAERAKKGDHRVQMQEVRKQA
ncbi:BZ3500_MvSof-1268-A1-R1_Chr2-1g04338 [Microbotryum saponariae]|uniref:BZ3500_MvSof-1268-A1-R1_Chr2-1g04338 protein n=1 Tax=Microbotryum saponariae TaxID=289078 RepID=A0A2X0KEM5_9BASI|nr:BZ3500_MvSof-1268-A1-R1_Chr2-1g04338 [Microbotryum saponariae]SCZ91479.1 BZ3501_MvSof-1269-A2-R1_Chr2-1g03994 [Microbotryum saponariae]